MLELKIKTAGRRYVAPDGLLAALGAQRARAKLADAIEALIVQLDMIDGDPDLEEDDLEDSHALSAHAITCASNSPAHDVEQDSGGWTEWHTRGRHKDSLGNSAVDGHPLHEDDEEDDAPEEDDPRESDGDDKDTSNAEDEVPSGAAMHYQHKGSGCEFSDPGEGEAEVCPTYGLDQTKVPTGHSATAEASTVRAILNRIRETRCVIGKSRFGHPVYPLINTRAVSMAQHPANNFI